ncbi:MAG: hypothetical protein AAF928_07755 [Myxococcota bacterium]
MTEPTTYPVRRIRRHRALFALSFLPFGLIAVGVAGALGGDGEMLMLLVHGLVLGSTSVFYVWQHNPLARLALAEARVVDGVLEIGDERHPVAALTRGVVMPAPDGAIVRLSRAGPHLPIDLRVGSEAEGRALLAELELGEQQSVVTFWGQSRIQLLERWKLTLLLMPIMVMVLVVSAVAERMLEFPLAFPLVMTLVGALVAPFIVGPQRVEVGADGVRLSWLGRRKFIPTTAIERAFVELVPLDARGVQHRHRVVIERRDGQPPVRIPISQDQTDFGRAETIAARIRGILQGRERRVHAASAHLRREPRQPLSAWVKRLRGLRQQASHRRSAVSRDALWATLEDATALPLDRAAAAVALRDETLAAPERRRIEVAARATVAPRLRIALERTLEDEEEALLEALADLEQEVADELVAS